MSYNYFQSYGNAYKKGERIKTITDRQCYRLAHDGTISDKQMQYHTDLFNFLLDKGLVRAGDVFDKPRNKKDCMSKINALRTILYKNGLNDEFYKKDGEANEK